MKSIKRLEKIPVRYFGDAMKLARASDGLHRWHERLCGDDRGVVYYDEETNKPFWQSANTGRKYRVRDMGAFYEKKVAEICGRNGLYYYIQGDPRGCALYVSKEEINQENYISRGIPV